MFANNEHARALYWFDCVDPVRYAVAGLGCYYAAERTPTLKAVLWCVMMMSRQVVFGGLFANARWLGTAAMGLGLLTVFLAGRGQEARAGGGYRQLCGVRVPVPCSDSQAVRVVAE